MTRTIRENHIEKGIFEQRLKRDFLGGSVVKTPFSNAGDTADAGSVPGLGRSSGEGNGNPLQSSCLENPRDGGDWWAAIYGVAQSRTLLKRLSSSSSSQYSCLENPMDSAAWWATVHGVAKIRPQLSGRAHLKEIREQLHGNLGEKVSKKTKQLVQRMRQENA